MMISKKKWKLGRAPYLLETGCAGIFAAAMYAPVL